MNTIPSKYHSQIKKMIKKDREEAKAEIIKMVEDKMINKQVLTMDEAGYNMALDDIIKELKKLWTHLIETI